MKANHLAGKNKRVPKVMTQLEALKVKSRCDAIYYAFKNRYQNKNSSQHIIYDTEQENEVTNIDK